MAYPSHIKEALEKALLDTPSIARRIANFFINECSVEILMQLYESDAIVRDALFPFKAAIGEIWDCNNHQYLIVEIAPFYVTLAHIGEGYVCDKIIVENVNSITRYEFNELIRSTGIPNAVHWTRGLPPTLFNETIPGA